MKQKYYLRGLGVGILVTAIVFAITGSHKMSDEEIIKRAKELGYEKTEDGSSSLNIKELMDEEAAGSKGGGIFTVNTPVPKETQTPVPTLSPNPELTITPAEQPTLVPTLSPAPTPSPTPSPTSTPMVTPTPSPEPTPTNTPAPVVLTAEIEVERGDSAIKVCEKIEAAGIVEDKEALIAYFVNNNLADYINIGVYTLSDDMSFEEIAKKLTER